MQTQSASGDAMRTAVFSPAPGSEASLETPTEIIAAPSIEEGPQQDALHPPQPEIPLEEPALNPCDVQRLQLGDGPDGVPETREVLVARESGRRCLLVRKEADAVYGDVWGALEVDIHDEGYFTVRRDEEGFERWLAVKRIPWDQINPNRGRLEKDPMRAIVILARLSNPGYASIFHKVEALDDGSTVYVLTPFVAGGDLFGQVSEHGKMPETVVKPLFRQVVEGMRYMHSKGICHTDLSLHNVLLDHDLRKAFIIRFGKARVMAKNSEGRRMMSANSGRKAESFYCPPEMFDDEAFDGVKVDVFSAGAMLFTMLTGKPPFEAATRADRNFEQLVWRRDVQGLLSRRGQPPLSDAAADLVMQMMAYRAEDRILPEAVLEHEWFA